MARARLVLASLALTAIQLSARPQVPPQAVEAAKKLGTKLVETLIRPKMKVEFFHLGGFKATQVDPDGDATAEKFSGTATFELPAPLGQRKLSFKGLVLKGSTAEGTLDEALKDAGGTLHGWSCAFTRVVLSDKGSRLEGTATLAGIRLDLAPLSLTPQGLTGTLNPGDLPLAEGPFQATLRSAEVTFSPSAVKLKGGLEILVDPPVRHGITGAELKLDGGPVTLDSSLLAKDATGTVAPALAANLPIRHKGLTWIVQGLAFRFERGTPVLGGPTRLQFPLQSFCKVGATDQPYLSEALPCGMRGKVPAPAAPASAGTRGLPAAPGQAAPMPAAPVRVRAEAAWEGFTGSFPLPAAELHPSGLTSYRVSLENGTARVEKGLLVPEGTQVSGKVAWGPGFTFETRFKDAQADLSEGLYVRGNMPSKDPEVGAYRIVTGFTGLTCDFSTAHSPKGLPEAWMGLHLPLYHLALPEEIFTWSETWERHRVLVSAKDGRFDGNGTFSGAVAANISKLVNLHIAPVRLQPFELRFVEGSLLDAPEVNGRLELTAEPLLSDFTPPVHFKLTQTGPEKIEIDTQTPEGPMALKTRLVGISMVLDSARLNPTNLDFTGRFDFAIAGAALPSVPFDHLTLEASGAGIDGSHEDLSLDFKGSRWSTMADRPHVNLWGYPLGLGETGYGVTGDGRFYVGLGGDFEVNGLLPICYNRMLFTTEKDNDTRGTLEMEKLFDFDQTVAAMGSLKASLGFQVKTADDQVSDAYFLGDGKLGITMGDAPFSLDAAVRFGRSFKGSAWFPYFYALGHFQMENAGLQVAPGLEAYGLAGGLAQNFLPDEIRSTKEVQGKPDDSLGLAIMAGVDLGTTDKFTLHGNLDLYVAENLTTILQGTGWLFCGRNNPSPDNQISADIRLTRNPTVFDATLEADLNLYKGLLRPMGQVALHFGPDSQFLHLGTKDAPIRARLLNSIDADAYLTADAQGGTLALGAGAGFSYSKEGDFGIVWGNAWLNARGDLIIEVDGEMNPHFLGTVSAEGGAAFGMRFATFWKTYKITIFSGSIGANLAFQVPGSPTLSGSVVIHYRVLGGLFSGSVGASLDI